ncbi:MAG: FmdB family zinc ribbon protein [Candidatus Fermentibacteria bacterium]|nr:FmdB family zinc ribbon protein [Candidatus Fermentibacteria bacterium]
MPIYEYYCSGCNTIYQFLIRGSRKSEDLLCPKCRKGDLERVMSQFSTTSSRSRSDDEMATDMADIDENDPRSMARAVRRMADEMGEDLGPELEHALGRLEAGEDPEKVEQELEEMGFSEEDGPGGMGAPSPGRDPGLY